MEKVNLDEKFGCFSEHWRPKIIGSLNGQELKVVKFKGEFVWHAHSETDELFMAWKGSFRIEFRDRVVTLAPGELVVIPTGVEHRPVADEEVEVLLIEAAETRNTGDVVDDLLTAGELERI